MQLRPETREILSGLPKDERARIVAVLGMLDGESGTMVHAHCGDGFLGAAIEAQHPNQFNMLGIEPGAEQAQASRRLVYSRIRREDYAVRWQAHRGFDVYLLTFGIFTTRIIGNVIRFLSRGNPLVIALATPGVHNWTAEEMLSLGLKRVAEGVYCNRG